MISSIFAAAGGLVVDMLWSVVVVVVGLRERFVWVRIFHAACARGRTGINYSTHPPEHVSGLLLLE